MTINWYAVLIITVVSLIGMHIEYKFKLSMWYYVGICVIGFILAMFGISVFIFK